MFFRVKEARLSLPVSLPRPSRAARLHARDKVRSGGVQNSNSTMRTPSDFRCACPNCSSARRSISRVGAIVSVRYLGTNASGVRALDDAAFGNAPSIWTAVFVREPPAIRAHHGPDVVDRIVDLISRRAIANLQEDHVRRSPIDQLMSGASSRKAHNHSGCQQRFVFLAHKRRRSLKYVDELILLAVAMQKGRFPSRQQCRQVHAEVLQAKQVSEWSLYASRHPA